MSKIVSITKVNNQPVYNMTVEKYHNYITKGGIISKNCDAARYFATFWNTPSQKEKAVQKKKWRADLLADYRHASKEIKALMVKQLGEPIL